MTMQKELREGVEAILIGSPNNDSPEKIAEEILSYLHSKGVAVVVVDKELPKCEIEYNPLACGAENDCDNNYRSGWEDAQKEMLNDGWKHVEPLTTGGMMGAKNTLFYINWGDGDDTYIIAPSEKTALDNMPNGKDMVNYIVKLDSLYQIIFEAGRKEVVKWIEHNTSMGISNIRIFDNEKDWHKFKEGL